MQLVDWILVFMAVFVPPVPVWCKRGWKSRDFHVNVALWLIGFLPCLGHALWVIATHQAHYKVRDTERARESEEEPLLQGMRRYGSV